MRQNLTRRSMLRKSAAGASAFALSAASARRVYGANEKVQLGWIGVGGRGTQLLTHLVNDTTGARMAAVCDLKQDAIDRGKKVAERDQPAGYVDFRKMMDSEKLDGILIATEVCNHAEVVVPVLEAGYHTFAEKPMDSTVEKIDQITRAARKAKGIYQIGTQRRYHPTYISAIKAIHDGIAGPVMFMQGGWHWSYDPAHIPVDCDGGRLIEQSSHHMDIMAWVMKDQPPIRCVAMGFSHEGREPNKFSETHSATTFQWPGGQLFSYTHLWRLPGKYDEEILKVFGEKGAVDLNAGKYYGRDEKTEDLGEASGKAWNRGTVEELQGFIDNVKTDGASTPNANVETGRVCSLMCIMGRMAMVNKKKNSYEPTIVEWKDLGSTTDA